MLAAPATRRMSGSPAPTSSNRMPGGRVSAETHTTVTPVKPGSAGMNADPPPQSALQLRPPGSYVTVSPATGAKTGAASVQPAIVASGTLLAKRQAVSSQTKPQVWSIAGSAPVPAALQ